MFRGLNTLFFEKWDNDASLSTTRVEKNFHANVTLFLAPKQLSQFEIPSRIFFSYALFFPLFNISRGRELFASFKKKILASKVPSLLRDLHFFLRYSIIPDFYSNRSRVHFVRLDEDRIRLKEEREDKERSAYRGFLVSVNEARKRKELARVRRFVSGNTRNTSRFRLFFHQRGRKKRRFPFSAYFASALSTSKRERERI